MKKYYIVECVNNRDEKYWRAYRGGILSIFGILDRRNCVTGTTTYDGPEVCKWTCRKLEKDRRVKFKEVTLSSQTNLIYKIFGHDLHFIIYPRKRG